MDSIDNTDVQRETTVTALCHNGHQVSIKEVLIDTGTDIDNVSSMKYKCL
ncbi:MAG: hypothetical protein ACI350_08360 [Prevotella sp.]